MRIIDFIKTKHILLLIALAVPLLARAEGGEITKFDNSNIQLETNCAHKNGVSNCTVYSVKDGGGKKKVVSFPFAPSNIDYKDGVFVVSFPCGTECSSTYFYDGDDKVGGPFPLVQSYDIVRHVVLSISKNSLRMYDIFAKERFKSIGKIDLSLNDDVDLADVIRGVKMEDHKFLITYATKNGDLATASKVIPNMAGRQNR